MDKEICTSDSLNDPDLVWRMPLYESELKLSNCLAVSDKAFNLREFVADLFKGVRGHVQEVHVFPVLDSLFIENSDIHTHASRQTIELELISLASGYDSGHRAELLQLDRHASPTSFWIGVIQRYSRHSR